MDYEQLPTDRLPLAELERLCASETRKRRRQEEDDPRFCLEIFRRALAAPPDQEARAAFVRLYTSFIEAKLPRSPVIMAVTSREDLVQDAWLFFWRAAKNGHLKFESLPRALAYLAFACKSAVFNALRSARKPEQPFDELFDAVDGAADPFSGAVKQAFLARLSVLVDNPLHARIFWLRYHDQLPPRQITQLLTNDGAALDGRPPTAQAVSQLLYQICRRLEQDIEIQQLLRGAP
jgi:hypothetical protein